MNINNYCFVDFEGKDYIVIGMYDKDENTHLCISDDIFSEELKKHKFTWSNRYARSSTGYTLHSLIVNVAAKTNIIFTQHASDSVSIDHINRVSKDNRIANLRFANTFQQNMNRKKLKSKLLCLPRNFHYIKKHSDRDGDRIEIKIKHLNIAWKTTSRKDLSIEYKIQEAKKYMRYLIDKHSEFKNTYAPFNFNESSKQSIQLYNEIIKKTHFSNDIINFNIIDTNDQVTLQEDLTKLSDFEKQVYNAMNFDQKTTLDVNANCEKKQTRINMLPVGCGVSYNDIPCNCYYSNATDTRGDCFVIDRHPFLVKQGLRQWSTTQARNKSTMQKFDLLKEKLKTLEDLSKENKIEVHVKQVRDNSLPKDCGMEASMLPKHCYFLHGSVKRGGKFVIDKHPKLVATGIKFWSTTGSINVSIEDKVFQFKAKLQELGITLMT